MIDNTIKRIIENNTDKLSSQTVYFSIGLAEKKKEIFDLTMILLKNDESRFVARLYKLEEQLGKQVVDKEKIKSITKELIKDVHKITAEEHYKKWREKRKKMDAALKLITISHLRKIGFKGSFPNFRRVGANQIELLRFEFSQLGPQFGVEISNCSLHGGNKFGKKIVPSKCTVKNAGQNRFRLGVTKEQNNYWRDFDSDDSEIYELRASEVVENMKEAERWWLDNCVFTM